MGCRIALVLFVLIQIIQIIQIIHNTQTPLSYYAALQLMEPSFSRLQLVHVPCAKKKMVIPATHIGQANQPVCGLERAGYGGHSWNELGVSAPLSLRDREH